MVLNFVDVMLRLKLTDSLNKLVKIIFAEVLSCTWLILCMHWETVKSKSW